MTCTGPFCTRTLGRGNTSGLCRSCLTKRNNADPAVQARRADGIREALKRPDVRANRLAALAKWTSDPVIREKRRQNGLKTYPRTLGSEKCVAALSDPKAIEKRTRTRLERFYAWCPPEYRADYRRLVRHAHVPASHAKAMTLERIEADRRRAEAELSPFDRQMRALRNGAGLVEKIAVSKAYDFSIVGGSLG